MLIGVTCLESCRCDERTCDWSDLFVLFRLNSMWVTAALILRRNSDMQTSVIDNDRRNYGWSCAFDFLWLSAATNGVLRWSKLVEWLERLASHRTRMRAEWWPHLSTQHMLHPRSCSVKCIPLGFRGSFNANQQSSCLNSKNWKNPYFDLEIALEWVVCGGAVVVHKSDVWCALCFNTFHHFSVFTFVFCRFQGVIFKTKRHFSKRLFPFFSKRTRIDSLCPTYR